VSFRTHITIEEVEGERRWRGGLYGRAMPTREAAPTFGVTSEQEDTFYRGRPEGRTEPIKLTFPDLTFAGEWKWNHLVTGDAKVLIYPPRTSRTPQSVCDFWEDFAARQKVVDVTWTDGVVRRCRWGAFTYQPGRGPDRKWTMGFKVLGRGGVVDAEAMPEVLSSRGAASGCRSAARGLDDALLTYPGGLAPTFYGQVRDAFGPVRESFATVRKALHDVGDLARAPATALRGLAAVAQEARGLMADAQEAWDATAYEYQVAIVNSENLLSARAYRGRVDAASRVVDDEIGRLLALAGAVEIRPRRYVAVAPGESLPRVALREYGSPELWTDIAAANGLVGTVVPPGVARLVIPEV